MTTIPQKPPTLPVQALVDTKDTALAKAGATRKVAYETMVAGLRAKTMTLDKFGQEHFSDDHTSRLRAAELISKLNGDLKTETTVDNRVVNISGVSEDVVRGLIQVVDDVGKQLTALRTSGKQTGEIIDVTVTTNG